MGISLITGHTFDRKEDALRDGRSPCWCLTLTLNGRARLGYDGGDYLVSSGSVVLHRPNALYTMCVAPPDAVWECVWAVFDPPAAWREHLAWPEVGPRFHALTLADETTAGRVAKRLLEMHELATSGLPLRVELATNALEEAMLWCETANPLALHARRDARIQRVIEHIEGHLTESLTLPELARVADCSVSSLVHNFPRETGMTAQQFVEERRMERASDLLRLTGFAVDAISRDVGYEDPLYFAKRFRKRFGVSPRQYRHGLRSPSSSAG